MAGYAGLNNQGGCEDATASHMGAEWSGDVDVNKTCRLVSYKNMLFAHCDRHSR